MKKCILFAVLLLAAFCASAQSQARIGSPKNHMDSANMAINRAKLWSRAFDVGNVNTLQQLSAEGTKRCDLEYISGLHQKEDSMIRWGKATWWSQKQDTICGIVGFLITPSFNLREGETVQTAPNLPLFVHTNSKGKWVVNIYFSELDLIECPCQMTEAEKKQFTTKNN